MHEHIMSKDRHDLLEKLKISPFDSFYLAGGTALALQLGHRWSEDLDFFSKDIFDHLELTIELSKFGEFVLTGQDKGTLHGLLGDVKLSFLHYPYSMLEDYQLYKGIKIAHMKDIALMKVVALVQRGTKKDFIDLFFIERQGLKIEQILDYFPVKFGLDSYDPLLIYKSIGYFEDADREIMPKMFNDYTWDDVKSYFVQRQKALLLA